MKMNDQNSLITVLTVILRALLTDLSRLCERSSRDLERDIRFITNKIDRLGLAFFTEFLPELGRQVNTSLATGSLKIVGLKRHKQIPHFMGDLFRKIWTVDGEFVSPGVGIPGRQPSIAALSAIRQVCHFAYKLELPFEKDKVDAKLDDFVRIDAELPVRGDSVSLSPETQAVVDTARLLIGMVFDMGSGHPSGRPFNPAEITPRHGPGAVATGERGKRKFRFARFYRRLAQEYPYEDYFYVNYGHLCDRLSLFEKLPEYEAGFAKLALVPKDSRGPRLISMEPLEYQWIQQGLGRSIMDWLEEHTLTRGFVNFSDQSINQRWARTGSLTSWIDTLDMKDASDRVSHWLVDALFPERIMRKLDAARTIGTVLPDGRRLFLRKFAPMGSALCFPVESLVFWALAMATLHRKACEDGPKKISSLASNERVYVYGDDLVVPHGSLDRLVPVFEELHLKFNLDKCCVGNYFRESCGVDAFHGVDVQPVRIKHIGTTPKALLSLCSNASAFHGRGLTTTAEVLYSCVEASYGPLPHCSDGSLALSRRSENEGDTLAKLVASKRFRLRYNSELQIFEVKSRQPIAVTYRDGWSGWEELLRWFTESGRPVSYHSTLSTKPKKGGRVWSHVLFVQPEYEIAEADLDNPLGDMDGLDGTQQRTRKARGRKIPPSPWRRLKPFERRGFQWQTMLHEAGLSPNEWEPVDDESAGPLVLEDPKLTELSKSSCETLVLGGPADSAIEQCHYTRPKAIKLAWTWTSVR